MSISVLNPKEGDKSRTYDELMKELLKVRCRDNGDGDSKVIDFANAEARRLERMTHIRRDTLEKIIFIFSSLVEDMEKKLPQIKEILRRIYAELGLKAEIR